MGKVMNLTVSGHKVDISEALENHARAALQNTIERHLGSEIIDAKVTLSKIRHLFRADISITLSKSFMVRSHAEDEDGYRSIDLAVQKLDSRAAKYKSRLRDRRRHQDVDEQALQAQYFVFDSEKQQVEEDTPVIVAEMEHDIPTLSVGDAVMRMDMSSAPVMMFKNMMNNTFNVVYRRNDGNIGWIDPSIKE